MKRRKSSRLTKYLLLAVIVYAVVTIMALQNDLLDSRRDQAALAAQAELIAQENEEWAARIAALGTDEEVMRLARERLHWVACGETVYENGAK
jgi:cell division protein FtsB